MCVSERIWVMLLLATETEKCSIIKIRLSGRRTASGVMEATGFPSVDGQVASYGGGDWRMDNGELKMDFK